MLVLIKRFIYFRFLKINPVHKGKITVKHYLNCRAKPVHKGEKQFYPLYVQIISKGKRAQLKSRISANLRPYRSYTEKVFCEKSDCDLLDEGYFTSDILKEIRIKNIFPLSSLLLDEIKIITDILLFVRDRRGLPYSLSKFGNFYDLHLRGVFNIVQEAVLKKYRNELNQLFTESTKSVVNRRLFKLSNFFIHYINWNTNFCEFYETTYEVLPSEIKYLENQLSPSLKLEIKALLAFHSRLSPLKRYMDKADRGLFPQINLNDWQETGKEFISKEFINIFGKQKAREFMDSIDHLIDGELNEHKVMVCS